jgi:hypothetical protein
MTSSVSGNARGKMTGASRGSVRGARMICDRTIAIRFFADELLPVNALMPCPALSIIGPHEFFYVNLLHLKH